MWAFNIMYSIMDSVFQQHFKDSVFFAFIFFSLTVSVKEQIPVTVRTALLKEPISTSLL